MSTALASYALKEKKIETLKWDRISKLLKAGDDSGRAGLMPSLQEIVLLAKQKYPQK